MSASPRLWIRGGYPTVTTELLLDGLPWRVWDARRWLNIAATGWVAAARRRHRRERSERSASEYEAAKYYHTLARLAVRQAEEETRT